MAEKNAKFRGGKRRMARFFAVQALYEIATTKRAAAAVLDDFNGWRIAEAKAEAGLGPPDPALLADIVEGACREGARIDSLLSEVLATDWPLERLSRLLRVLLQAGVYELAFGPVVPPRVVISEYLALADVFFTEGEPGMVNGLLDRLGRQLHPAEFGESADS